MNARQPNTITVELMAAALGDLTSELVLVGGCAVDLLITDAARPPVRQTIDVDLVAQVTSLMDYYAIGKRLRRSGFREDASADHMGRWRKAELILDLMPSSANVLGHSTNRWYPAAVQSAQRLKLPSGREILCVSAPLFIATKFESFHGRADGDWLHHDMEDIVNVVDGRPELADEVQQMTGPARDFIRDEVDDLLADAGFPDALPGLLLADAANQARLPLIIGRLQRLAGL